MNEERFWIIEKSFTVAAGGNDAGSVEIGSFDFRWEALGAEWDDTKGIWSVKITDNSLNQSFSADKVSLKAIVGDGKQPYQLLRPAVFGAGGRFGPGLAEDFGGARGRSLGDQWRKDVDHQGALGGLVLPIGADIERRAQAGRHYLHPRRPQDTWDRN